MPDPFRRRQKGCSSKTNIVLFTALVMIIDLFAPGSFSQKDTSGEGLSSFIYFGFVTLTTLGYRDINPHTPVARSMASFTALLGQLYLVIIMALIIGKYLN